MADFPVDTSDRPGWGPWVAHFGGDCPLRIGDVFQPVLRLQHWDNALMTQPSVLTEFGKTHFIWQNDADADCAVIQYRLLQDLSQVYSIHKSVADQHSDLDKFCRQFVLQDAD
jgi:hypothetical protein